MRKIILILALVMALQLAPLASGQNEYGYASYTFTRYDAYYQGLHLVVEAPGNESDVATNQALPIRVMPIDLDNINESLTMYVEGVEYYEFWDENYYKMPVIVTSELNSTFTIEFRAGNQTLLVLEYLVTLTTPSMSEDYTDLFEELMREREKERMEELYTTVPKGYEKIITAEVIATTLAITITAIILAVIIKRKLLLISTANPLNIFILMAVVIVGMMYIGLRVSPYLAEETDLPTLYMVLIDLLIGLLYTAAFIVPYFITYHVVKLSNQKVIHETELRDKNINLVDTVIYTNREGKKCIALQDICSALRRLTGGHVLVDTNGPLHSDWTLNNEDELILADKMDVIEKKPKKEPQPEEDEKTPEDEEKPSLLARIATTIHPEETRGAEVCKLDLAQMHYLNQLEFVHDVTIFNRLRKKLDTLVADNHILKHMVSAIADVRALDIIARIMGKAPSEDMTRHRLYLDEIGDRMVSSIKPGGERNA